MNDSQLIWEAYQPGPHEGLATSWSDPSVTISGKMVTITMPEVLKYLDDNKVEAVPVSIEVLKSTPMLGGWGKHWDLKALQRSGTESDIKRWKRIQGAEVDHAIVRVIGLDGNYKSILDGNHRLAKALNYPEQWPELPTRDLDLRTAPEHYQKLLNYPVEANEGQG